MMNKRALTGRRTSEMVNEFEQRAIAILHNLALEHTGWRRYVFGRWFIPAEPLRNDAGRLLRRYTSHEKMCPPGTRVCGAEDDKSRCHWRVAPTDRPERGGVIWSSECRRKFELLDGKPHDYGMHWCPFCGKDLVHDKLTGLED